MTTMQESTVLAPFAGTVIAIAHEPLQTIRAGTAIVILEAMKMEHEVIAELDGVLQRLEVSVGDTVEQGQLLAVLSPGRADPDSAASVQGTADAEPRIDLQAVDARHASDARRSPSRSRRQASRQGQPHRA